MQNKNTEEHIKDVAREIFFSEGRLNATTQDIADAAGVNRTLLNYYFRSRDALFDIVFEESMIQFAQNMNSIISQTASIGERIEHLIDFILKEMSNNPYREIFFITQINQSNNQKVKPKKELDNDNWKIFLNEIQIEMDAGRIQSMTPVNYVLNLFSLCIFPALMKPVYTKMFQVSQKEYKAVLDNRKANIMNYFSLSIK
jgi:TetR/AcrR family transcriptional regulator